MKQKKKFFNIISILIFITFTFQQTSYADISSNSLYNNLATNPELHGPERKEVMDAETAAGLLTSVIESVRSDVAGEPNRTTVIEALIDLRRGLIGADEARQRIARLADPGLVDAWIIKATEAVGMARRSADTSDRASVEGRLTQLQSACKEAKTFIGDGRNLSQNIYRGYLRRVHRILVSLMDLAVPDAQTRNAYKARIRKVFSSETFTCREEHRELQKVLIGLSKGKVGNRDLLEAIAMAAELVDVALILSLSSNIETETDLWWQLYNFYRSTLDTSVECVRTKIQTSPPFRLGYNDTVFGKERNGVADSLFARRHTWLNYYIRNLILKYGHVAPGHLNQVCVIGNQSEFRNEQFGLGYFRFFEMANLRTHGYPLPERIEENFDPESEEFTNRRNLGVLYKWGYTQMSLAERGALRKGTNVMLIPDNYNAVEIVEDPDSGENVVQAHAALFYDARGRLALARFRQPIRLDEAVLPGRHSMLQEVEKAGIPVPWSSAMSETERKITYDRIFPAKTEGDIFYYPRQVSFERIPESILRGSQADQAEYEKREKAEIETRVGARLVKRNGVVSSVKLILKPATGSGYRGIVSHEVNTQDPDLKDVVDDIYDARRGDDVVAQRFIRSPFLDDVATPDLLRKAKRALRTRKERTGKTFNEDAKLEFNFRTIATRTEKGTVVNIKVIKIRQVNDLDEVVFLLDEGMFSKKEMPEDLIAILEKASKKAMDRINRFTRQTYARAENPRALDGRSYCDADNLSFDWVWDGKRFALAEFNVGLGTFWHHNQLLKNLSREEGVGVDPFLDMAEARCDGYREALEERARQRHAENVEATVDMCRDFMAREGLRPDSEIKTVHDAYKAGVLSGIEMFDGYTRFLAGQTQLGSEVAEAYIGEMGLDARPIRNRLLNIRHVGLDMAVRKIANPDNDGADTFALYAGSGAGWSNIALSINAPNVVFADKTRVPRMEELERCLNYEWNNLSVDNLGGMTNEKAREFLLGYANDEYENGYASSDRDKTNYIEYKILFELKNMGVKKLKDDGSENIKITSNEDDGTITLSFEWAYSGQDTRPYSITFMETDITNPSSWPNNLKVLLASGKVRWYYQRAGFEIPLSYSKFLPRVASCVRFLITDDKAYSYYGDSEQSCDDHPEHFLGELNYTKRGEASSKEMVLWRSLIEKNNREDAKFPFHYGWDMCVRRNKEIGPGGAIILAKEEGDSTALSAEEHVRVVNEVIRELLNLEEGGTQPYTDEGHGFGTLKAYTLATNGQPIGRAIETEGGAAARYLTLLPLIQTALEKVRQDPRNKPQLRKGKVLNDPDANIVVIPDLEKVCEAKGVRGVVSHEGHGIAGIEGRNIYIDETRLEDLFRYGTNGERVQFFVHLITHLDNPPETDENPEDYEARVEELAPTNEARELFARVDRLKERQARMRVRNLKGREAGGNWISAYAEVGYDRSSALLATRNPDTQALLLHEITNGRHVSTWFTKNAMDAEKTIVARAVSQGALLISASLILKDAGAREVLEEIASQRGVGGNPTFKLVVVATSEEEQKVIEALELPNVVVETPERPETGAQHIERINKVVSSFLNEDRIPPASICVIADSDENSNQKTSRLHRLINLPRPAESRVWIAVPEEVGEDQILSMRRIFGSALGAIGGERGDVPVAFSIELPAIEMPSALLEEEIQQINREFREAIEFLKKA